MGIFDLAVIAVALSMDTFALSLSNGLTILNLRVRQSIIMALVFALFQGLLPVFGFFLGKGLEIFIKSYAHWIALILLAVIGGKMIYEGIKCAKEEECPVRCFVLKLIVLQAIATSIDALMVGVTFATMGISLPLAIIIISTVTFIISFSGIYIGRVFGTILKSKSEIFGGAILVIIGIKIFLENAR